MAATRRPTIAHRHNLGELTALTALGLVIAASVVLWTAGQAGSLLTGHGTIPAGPATGLGVLVRLPNNIGNPADAWPSAAHPHVPGPFLFYALVLAQITALAALGTTTIPPLLHRRRRKDWPLGVEPNAGLAKRGDLAHLHVNSPVPGRLSLGTVGGQRIAAEPDISLAVIGPTGCGKTIGFAIPALNEWTHGPVLCTSVKTDLLAHTLDHRRHIGKVWIFDPTGATEHPTARWNPIKHCHTETGAAQVAAWLIDVAPTNRGTLTDADHWQQQAVRALQPLLMAAAHRDLTMRHVARWVDLAEEEAIRQAHLERAGFDSVLARHIAEHEDCTEEDDDEDEDEANAAVDAALEELIEAGALDSLLAIANLWDQDPRFKGSVFASVQNAVLVYTDPTVAHATELAGNQLDINFDEWLAGPNTIYLVAPSHDQRRLKPLFTAFLERAVQAAFTTANLNGGRLDPTCLILLDEAANIAPVRDLPQWASTARSHGITLATIWQDLAQIKTIYGDSAPTVLNNHLAKWFGSGIADLDTLTYISELIGDTDHWQQTWSTDQPSSISPQRDQRRSMSEHAVTRRLATRDMIRRLPTGEGVLLYRAAMPLRSTLRQPRSAATDPTHAPSAHCP